MARHTPRRTSISFRNIDKFSIRYWLMHWYVEFTFRYLYYNRFEVVGIENIPPADTPLLIVSNHQNGLNDALCILCMFPDRRQPVFIARSDMFKKKIVARMLRAIKILPAFRPRDGEDPRKNDEIFEVSADVLKHHHTLMVFPEGAHNEGNWLSNFRKGFARAAFKAEEESNFTLGVQVMPMGLYYSDYVNMRQSVALVMGKPIALASYLPLYQESPEKAQLALARDMYDHVEGLMLNITSESDYPQYNTARLLYEPYQLRNMGLNPRKIYHKLLAGRQVVAGMKSLQQTNPTALQHQLHLADRITQGVAQAKLRPWVLGTSITPGWLVPRTLLLVLLAPLYALLWVLNVLPYNAPKLITQRVPDRMLHSSFAYGLSIVVTYPLFYIPYSIALGLLAGSLWYALLALPLLVVGLLVFYYYRIGFVKIRGAWRYYRHRRTEPMILLRNQYHELIHEMDKMMGAEG